MWGEGRVTYQSSKIKPQELRRTNEWETQKSPFVKVYRGRVKRQHVRLQAARGFRTVSVGKNGIVG